MTTPFSSWAERTKLKLSQLFGNGPVVPSCSFSYASSSSSSSHACTPIEVYLDQMRELLRSSPGGSADLLLQPAPHLISACYDPTVLTSTVEGASLPTHVHSNVHCDALECLKSSKAGPIRDTRWKCNPLTGCGNFDYCEKHYEQWRKEKELMQKDNKQQQPHDPMKTHDPSHEFYPLHRPTLAARELYSESAIQIILNSCANYGSAPFIGEMKHQPLANETVPMELVVYQDDNGKDSREMAARAATVLSSSSSASSSSSSSSPPPFKYHPRMRRSQYTWYSFTDFRTQFLSLSHSLRNILPRRSMFGLYAPNCLEWVVTEAACMMNDLISVAVHAKYTEEVVEAIVKQTKLKMMMVKGRKQMETMVKIKEKLNMHHSSSSSTSFSSSSSSSSSTKNTKNDEEVLKFLLYVKDETDEDEKHQADVDALTQRAVASGLCILDYTALLSLSLNLPAPHPLIPSSPSDLTSIIYTSGSTGMPKGSMFTEAVQQKQLAQALLRWETQNALELEVFPFAWMTGKLGIRHAMGQGTSLAIYSGSPEDLLDEYKRISPTRVLAVPAIWNQLYQRFKMFAKVRREEWEEQERERIRKQEEEEREEKKEKDATIHSIADLTSTTSAVDADASLADTSTTAPTTTDPSTSPTTAATESHAPRVIKDFDRVVIPWLAKPVTAQMAARSYAGFSEYSLKDPLYWLNDFRRTYPLGPSVDSIITGGAMSSPELLAFLRALYAGIRVSNGYGTTEAGGIMTNGVIKGELKSRMISRPDLGYTLEDQPFPRGELLVKGPEMIVGYYDDPAATQEKFTEDGYFRTGDIVEKFEEHEYRIIDRCSSVFKLMNGEFISPENIENVYMKSAFIEACVVYGAVDKSGVVAVVVPNKLNIRKEIERMMGEKGTTLSDADLISQLTSPAVNSLVRADITRLCKESNLPLTHYPLGIHITPESFTVENHLLTVSFKVARFQVVKKFKEEIEELYKKWRRENGESEGETKVGEIDAVNMSPPVLASPEAVNTSSSNTSEASSSSSSSSSSTASATSTSTSADRLAEIMSRVLSISQQTLSSSVDIRKLGISSVAAVQLSQQVKKEMGDDYVIPVQVLLDQSKQTSVEELAKMIEDAGKSTNKGNTMKKSEAQEAEERQQLELKELLVSDMELPLSAPDVSSAANETSISSFPFSIYQQHALTPTLTSDQLSTAFSSPLKHILLTGMTGFLGGQMLWELLKADEHTIVHCLVRDDSSAAAIEAKDDAEDHVDETRLARVKSRVINSLKQRDLFSPSLASRILVYPSSIEKHQLGLSTSVFLTLAAHISTVYHSAAAVNWILAYPTLREANVIGTQEILRFAALAQEMKTQKSLSNEASAASTTPAAVPPVKFVYISTLGVAGRSGPARSVFYDRDTGIEAFLPSARKTVTSELLDRYSSGYNLSKWVGEWLVSRSAALGYILHPTIIRPGFIGPNSETGDSGPQDFLTRYIATCLQLNRYVDTTRTFEFTPVDQVAKQTIVADTVPVAAVASSSSHSHATSSSSSSSSRSSSVAVLHVSSDHSVSPDSTLLSYHDIGALLSRTHATIAADAGVPLRPSSASEFVSLVASTPSTPLYPLLAIISAPGYFGFAASSGEHTSSTLSPTVQSRAIEHCVRRGLRHS